MRRATLTLLLTLAGSIGHAAETTIGTSLAQACFEAATDHPASADPDVCTDALRKERLSASQQAATYSNRGIIYANTGALDKAIEDQNMALALDPKSARAHNNRANAYYRAGRHAEAIADYDAAVALSAAPFAQLHYNRAMAHQALGDTASAKRDLERAIELAPDTQQYKDALAAVLNAATPAKPR